MSSVVIVKTTRNAAVVAAAAIVYVLLHQLNATLFSSLWYAEGVNWIYLPGGFRLMVVLLFMHCGALGVALASMILAYFDPHPGNVTSILGAAFIAGFAPWLARRICVDLFKLDLDLKRLTAGTLLKVSLVFSILCPVVQQLWLTWQGTPGNFVGNTVVMVIGDWIGTLMLLYLARYLLSLTPALRTD